MEKIADVEQLVNVLESCTKKDFPKVARYLDIPVEELNSFASWEKDHYTRNCISRSEDYELILLCWDKGQDTPIHCHGGKECWVKMISGTIREKRFDANNFRPNFPDEVTIMKAGDISYMNDDIGYHSLHQEGNQRAMSLHLYVSPIQSCRVYDPETQRFSRKQLQYDTVCENCMS